MAFDIGIIDTTDTSDMNYRNLETFVEETQSFIKMVKYSDYLVVKISDIDGNLINDYDPVRKGSAHH